MKTVSEYSKDKRKELGAFYSPQILSDFLAKRILSLYQNGQKKVLNALDPATGDTILLYSLSKQAFNYGLEINILGLDIDSDAVKRSQFLFQDVNIHSTFLCTDALYPYNQSSPSDGWDKLKSNFFPNGIDLIVSNPPWGADISNYSMLGKHFDTALGQYDSYDLFVETILKNLNEGGCYAIIIPDSIYCREHYYTRKLLLDKTTICEIVRLGEGFFPNVNFAVSIIFGINKKSEGNLVECIHLSNTDRKNILKGEATMESVCKKSAINVDSKMMISYDYSFITDVSAFDLPLMSKLNSFPKFIDFVTSHRGVELSKKGVVLRCPECGKWFPLPRKSGKNTKCPHCKSVFINDSILTRDNIISEYKLLNSNLIVVGEDISRYRVNSHKSIKLGYDGIKYKDASFYDGVKVLVRKTGVGITAGIDYKKCHANQVVYIIKPKKDLDHSISCEVILSLLNSRIMTYYIIKQFGNTGWKSNPYLSQDNIMSLPFPKIDINDKETAKVLSEISCLVKKLSTAKTINKKSDLAIECLVAKLYGISGKDYRVIMGAIRSVESLIPFKRLLSINEDDITNNGL